MLPSVSSVTALIEPLRRRRSREAARISFAKRRAVRKNSGAATSATRVRSQRSTSSRPT